MAVVSAGTTIIDAGALGASAGAGKLTLIKTLTASGSSTLSFVDGASSVVLDATYDSYVFKFINLHPSTNNLNFQFNLSIDSGSNYNVTKTTSYIRAYGTEDGSTGLGYRDSYDLAQSTNYQTLMVALEAQNDNGGCGSMQLFNPSSTTFVKHFVATSSFIQTSEVGQNSFVAGYGNTTSAVNAIRFQTHSGNFDGVIKLYGIGG